MKKRICRILLGLLVLIGFEPAFAQKTIKGKITDAEDGLELPGVYVVVKGTETGTVTGLDGSYSLSVTEDAILVYSFIGYKTIEQAVGSRTVIDISLEADIEELSEVVVIGYGQVEAKDVTGVVSKVDEKAFNKGMLTTPEQLIAGKVAGVQVTQNSGEPGGGLSIRIRGGSSLGAAGSEGAGPLYVVDGVPLEKDVKVAGTRNALAFINPADIEDITILKDASAAAIYGSRGASGVVIITTKSGKLGKPQFTYDGSFSVSSIIDEVEMLTTPEFIFTVQTKAPQNERDLGVDGQLYDTDWSEEILRTAYGQNHNLGASFGIGNTTTSRVSLNYQNLNGILETSNTERIAGSVNLTSKFLDDALTITYNSKHSFIDNRFAENVTGDALIYAPTQPIFLPDGSGYFEWGNTLAADNPVGKLNRTFNIGKTERNLFSGSLEYKLPFIEGLSAKVSYAYDQADGLSQKSVIESGRPGNTGEFTYTDERNSSNLFESYLTYAFNTSIGYIDLLGGYSYQDNKVEIFNKLEKNDTVNFQDLNIVDLEEYINDSKLDEISPLISPELTNPTENRLISYWGRANISIKDKYLITGTLRRDGSTRFAESNRWGTFPSLAIGWRLIDEPFMSRLEQTFSNLKFRVSWGITGNQDIDDYRYIPVYEPGGERAQYLLGQDTVNTIRPVAVDLDLKWEETTSLNIGIDFGIFNGRLNGSVEYYNKNTSDLLLDAVVPIGGVPGDRILTNAGEFESKGFEFLLNGVAVDKKDLRVDLSLNAAYNQNEILKLNEAGEVGFGLPVGGISGDVGQNAQILRVGHANPSFLVYEHIRDGSGTPLNDSDDHNGDGLTDDLDIYVDQNQDGIINEDDLVVTEDPLPDWIFGFTGNVTYKNFDMAMTWRGSLGNYAYNNVFSAYGSFQDIRTNDAPSNIHVSAYTNDFDDRQLLSDIYVEDASFIKLDNITIGYRFNTIEKLNARAYVTASNLLIISDYSGIDPESGGFEGIDNNLYPRSRTFVLGLNLTF